MAASIHFVIMKLAIAQIDSIVADFSANLEKICAFTNRAVQEYAPDLILFPELALCGYPPMDLLDQDSFTEENIRALRQLQRKLPGHIAVGVGYVDRNTAMNGKKLLNAYVILCDGKLIFQQDKTLLPTYDVFDEARYFEKAHKRSLFEFKNERIGIAICEDMWRETGGPDIRYAEDPVKELMDLGATMLCVPSASPYYANKHQLRLSLVERISRRGNLPILYINAVGANDSIIFDGRSFIATPQQYPNRQEMTNQITVVQKAAPFKEDLVYWDSTEHIQALPEHEAPYELDTLEDALVLGIQAYMQKCGFSKLHIGLSGGIDSALVACLAARAAGPDRLHFFGLPSRYSSRASIDDAAELAANLGVSFSILPIEQSFAAMLETLDPVFKGLPHDLTEENLQARIRGTLLMAYSNKFNSLLLTTGNKSELAMGYCTLYGDMAGALAPIGDLFKNEVFALCRRINERHLASEGRVLIPENILVKAPSAELRPDQKDEDSLPPYETLDKILRLYLIDNLSCAEITRQGWDPDLTSSILEAVARAEYKRRQAPPVLKVSPRAFGMGRRMPIARNAYEASLFV